MKIRLPILMLLLLATLPLAAQAPSADWRTVTTPHFRVHYPAEYEAWSLRAAGRLEAIRSAVVTEAGYEPPQVIDIVVVNPFAEANGLAWPLLDSPRIVFYAHPPLADDQIGEYGEWSELLAVHEIAHVVHLARPSRNPLRRISEQLLLPAGPMVFSAPRWVIEGYATVVEGRLTGTGRPSSSIRAAILRKWAREGRLPSYGQLNGDSRFLGLSMAYLTGSAYLEWLEQRNGEGSLRKLWARMTARQPRSFDQAFEGVFGDSPERLYGLFSADLTASAVTIARGAAPYEGSLWQQTRGASGDPVVSPDGSQIAIVIRPKSEPPRLVVWNTGESTVEDTELTQRIERMLKADPEDVAPVRVKPLARKPVYQVQLPTGGSIESPRWTPDGNAILFIRKTPDRTGMLHDDVALWDLRSGSIVALTDRADISDADVFPDAKRLVGVRNRFGLSQLVTIDLTTGALTELTTAAPDRVYAQPRVNREGTKIVYAMHREGGWRAAVRDLATGVETELDTDGATVAGPEWARDAAGGIIASVGSSGFIELYRLREGAAPVQLTRTLGAAVSPAPSPDGRIFFMSLDPDGFVVRELSPAPDPIEPVAPLRAEHVPAVPPLAGARPDFAITRDLAPRAYGAGRQEVSFLASETLAPHQKTLEAGVRIGDVVGRLNTLVLGSFTSGDGVDGFAVASAWRGWPVDVIAHAYSAEQAGSDYRGGELRGRWTARASLARAELDAGVHFGERDGEGRDLAFVSASGNAWRLAGKNRLSTSGRIVMTRGDVETLRGSGKLGISRGATGLAAEVAFARTGGGKPVFEIGGTSSSILPESALATRILDPAVDLALLTGDRYELRRLEARPLSLPVTFFWQQHATWFAADGQRRKMRVAGLEATYASEAMPLLKLPPFDLSAGVARLLDEPRRDDTSVWLTLIWRP